MVHPLPKHAGDVDVETSTQGTQISQRHVQSRGGTRWSEGEPSLAEDGCHFPFNSKCFLIVVT